MSGGYNKGCLYMLQPGGVVIKPLKWNEKVPPGASTCKRDFGGRG